MSFYYKSEAEVQPVAPPDGGGGGGDPPLIIWGPGDPRPTLPIAGWDPGSGAWPKPPATIPPPEINMDPMPTNPIAEPPWGWGNPPPKPDVPATPGWKVMYGWTPSTGWFVFAIPTGPVPTPSKKK
jgi:hypothetical protein